MSNRIDIANNKTLKLTNVLIRKIEFGKEENIQIVVEQMIIFLKARSIISNIGEYALCRKSVHIS